MSTFPGRFNASPSVLKAFILFASAAALLLPIRLASQELNQTLILYAGWSGYSVYAFALLFAILALFGARRGMMRGVIFFLLIAVVVGLVDAIWRTFLAPDSFDNPYLEYNNLRPLFTVALPAIWVLVLSAAKMRSWARAATTGSAVSA